MMRVLVVDDERNVREYLKELLQLHLYQPLVAETGAAALAVLREVPVGLVILDLKLPDADGIELIPRIKELCPGVAILVITALGTIQHAVDSIKAGAYDFITKPFDIDTILIAVNRVQEFISIREENIALRRQRDNRLYYEEFIGASPHIERIKDVILRLSHVDVPVLITGETGTGKNVLAKLIHYTWREQEAPLVHMNCSSIPEALFESELFGHEKGAFTGAVERKRGLVEEADGGTLILDEITDMPTSAQAKLLTFLQDRSFYRVGGSKPHSVSTRIIALSNRDLAAETQTGSFRKDLFYRLDVVHFVIPPLRERGRDVLLIADSFMEELRLKYDQPEKRLTERCREWILSQRWPGNIRQLRNVLERAFIFIEGSVVDICDVRVEEPPPDEPKDLKSIVGCFEEMKIREALVRHEGNRLAAAEDLGISLRTLHYKLNRGRATGD